MQWRVFVQNWLDKRKYSRPRVNGSSSSSFRDISFDCRFEAFEKIFLDPELKVKS